MTTLKNLQFVTEGNKFKLTHIGGLKIDFPFTLAKINDGEKVEINGGIIKIGNRTFNIHDPSVNESISEMIWIIDAGENIIRVAKIGDRNLSIFAGGVYTFQ